MSLMVVLLTIYSCQRTDEDTIEFEELTYDKVINLSNEELSPTCTVSLKLQNATESNGHRSDVVNNEVIMKLFNVQDISMETAMQRFGDNYINNYKQNLLPLYNQDRADTTKRAWYEYHYVISAETQKGSKNTMAYLATLDYYEGGAYGTHQLITMNFDIMTGRLMKLSDIFVEGSQSQLNKVLLNSLFEKMGVSTTKELQEKGYLQTVNIYTPENFIIGDETITFIYNPSEIAPYSSGSTELIIPYSKVEKLLKNSFVHSS